MRPVDEPDAIPVIPSSYGFDPGDISGGDYAIYNKLFLMCPNGRLALLPFSICRTLTCALLSDFSCARNSKDITITAAADVIAAAGQAVA